MRCDQSMGLCKQALAFLEANEVKPESCPTCKRPLDQNRRIIGHYDGFDTHPLYQHVCKNGRLANEYLQAQPWSSGPVAFLGLKVYIPGQAYEVCYTFYWSEKDIADATEC